MTRDEVADHRDLQLWLEVDGRCFQSGSARQMIHSIAEIVSHLSDFMTLEPGDIVSIGSPAGAGEAQKPEPVYLRPGDRIRLGITGLGVQE